MITALAATPLSAIPGLDWPGVPPPAGQAMLAMLGQLDRTQWLAPPDLEERQFVQLRKLFGFAERHIPHYQGHLVTSGIAEAADLTPASFLRLPLLDKRAIQADPARLLCDPPPAHHGALRWVTTSGSSGQPLRAAGTDVSVFFQHALLLRSQFWYGLDLTAKFATIRMAAEEAAYSDWGPPANAVFRTGPSATNNVFLDHRLQLDWLIREAPAYLLAHNTNLRALIETSRRTGRLPAGLKVVLGFGDMAPPDLSTLAREVWGARYFDSYSASEVGPIALQCPEHGNLHVQAEHVMLEALREDGSPCAPGEDGRLVVTDLHNFAMPLIRYDLGDRGALGAPCACGRGLPVLQRVVGRAGQLAVDPTGRSFYPHLNHGFWVEIGLIQQRQVAQIAIDTLEVRYVAERDLDAAEGERLTGALREAMRYDYRIVLTRVAAIPHAPGGKFDDFVALPASGRQS